MPFFNETNVSIQGEYVLFQPLQEEQLFEYQIIPDTIKEIIAKITTRDHRDQFVGILEEFFETNEAFEFSAGNDKLVTSRTMEFSTWVKENNYNNYVGTDMGWDEFHSTDKKGETMKNIDDERCVAIKRDGTQCKNNKKTDNPLFCGPHETQSQRKELKTVISDIEVQNKMAESFSQQSEETKEVVRKAVRNIIENTDHVMTRLEMNDLFIKDKKEDYDIIIGGTGARSLKTASRNTKAWVAHYVRNMLKQLKETYGDKLAVLSGMAEGFDELIAKIAIELEIDLIAAIPSEDYGNYYWANRSLTGTNRIEEFNAIVEYATTTGGVVYVCDDYRGHAPQRPGKANLDRNDFMVKLATGFYAWDVNSRGTSHCIKTIERAGKRFVDIQARLPEYIEKVNNS